MKEMLSSMSQKTKYVIAVTAAIFVTINIAFVIVLNLNLSIDSSTLFEILAICEIVLIMYTSIGLYKLIKDNSVLGSIYGITAEELSEVSTIFNSVSEGLIVVDSKGKVRNINKCLCRILGTDESQMINKNLYNMLNELDNNVNTVLPGLVIESLETHKEFRQKEKVTIRDKEVLYLSVSTYMLKNKSNNVTGVLAVVNDATRSKKLEQQLMHVERLATVGQMAAELAHEIKNPICSIKGLIQILGKKHSLEDSKYYEVITNEIDRISGLLQGFLTLTQNKPKLEKVSITDIVEEVVPLIESYAENKKIDIIVDVQRNLPGINADRENIRQVVVNIVQNGIDALPYNGKMNISLWYDQINDLIKIEFKDNGRGIKPEYMDKIFEPFFTTKEKGSGLGLAISHKIIENHGGKLFAFNNLEGGASFVIELPTAKRSEANKDMVS